MLDILRSRLLAAALATAALFGAWFLTKTDKPGYPLILIPQGVSVKVIDDERVFVVREGSSVTLFSPVTPGSQTGLVWCPKEQFFVAPTDKALYDREGQYVAGPGARDMDTYAVRLDYDALEIHRGKRVQHPKSNGEISGEAGQAYVDWAADPDRDQGFCQGPVR